MNSRCLSSVVFLPGSQSIENMKAFQLLSATALVYLGTLVAFPAFSQKTISFTSRPNLAVVAVPTGANRFGPPLNSLNDGSATIFQGNGRLGDNRAQPRSMYWVQYEWKQPISTKEIAVYWWNYNNGIRLPEAYRVSYWDGNNFVPVKNATGLGLVNNELNATTFDEIKTTRLRLELDSADRFSATMQEWLVYPSENSAPYPPVVSAGVDRDVMMGGKTYL